MNNLITVAKEDIKFLKEYYGYTLLNKGKHKLQNTVKGYVWQAERTTRLDDGREDTTTILYKKLEDAITNLSWEKLIGGENYSGTPSIPKILDTNHIYVYGIDKYGTEYRLSIVPVHIF